MDPCRSCAWAAVRTGSATTCSLILLLHKWFRQKNRLVPGFVIFDQPSQAHYPPERDAEGSLDVLGDEDQTAVLQLFKLISDAAAELAPQLQIIVMDHADLK